MTELSDELAYIITGKEQLSTVPASPADVVLPGHVVVEIRMTGICGSDIEAYHLGFPYGPTLAGHEWSGVIHAVGEGVEGFHVGDRVARTCQPACGTCSMCAHGQYELCLNRSLSTRPTAPPHGGYARYIPVPAVSVTPLPDSVSFEAGAIVEPATVALHAVRRVTPRLGDTALVLGGGIVGLTTLQLAQRAGALNVVLIDPSPERREQARTLGANHAFAPDDPALTDTVLNLTGGRGADLAYECAGRKDAINQATALLRLGGRLMLVGVPFTTIEFAPASWLAKQIDVSTSLAHTREEFELTVELLGRGWLQTDPLTFDVRGLSEIEAVFAGLTKGAAAVKTIIDPWR